MGGKGRLKRLDGGAENRGGNREWGIVGVWDRRRRLKNGELGNREWPVTSEYKTLPFIGSRNDGGVGVEGCVTSNPRA